jgi:hypothetical protein
MGAAAKVVTALSDLSRRGATGALSRRTPPDIVAACAAIELLTNASNSERNRAAPNRCGVAEPTSRDTTRLKCDVEGEEVDILGVFSADDGAGCGT